MRNFAGVGPDQGKVLSEPDPAWRPYDEFLHGDFAQELQGRLSRQENSSTLLRTRKTPGRAHTPATLPTYEDMVRYVHGGIDGPRCRNKLPNGLKAHTSKHAEIT